MLQFYTLRSDVAIRMLVGTDSSTVTSSNYPIALGYVIRSLNASSCWWGSTYSYISTYVQIVFINLIDKDTDTKKTQTYCIHTKKNYRKEQQEVKKREEGSWAAGPRMSWTTCTDGRRRSWRLCSERGI